MSDVWTPPEPDDPPAGWGGWALVQVGLPSFERTKYAADESGNVIWRYVGWGPWRQRDGFWGDPKQAARILLDGYLRGAYRAEDGSIVYTRDPLNAKSRRWLMAAVHHAAKRA